MKNSPATDITSKEPTLVHTRFMAPLMTFIMGAILSVVVFSVVRDWKESELRSGFEVSARNRLAALQSDIIRHQEVVNSLVSMLTASDNVTRKMFHTFVRDALSRQPSIHGLSWNPLIKHTDRDKYRQNAIAEGFTDFLICELDDNGQKIKAPQRDEYVAVYYIEPFEANEQALGFNIASNPARLKAINQARDSGDAVITEKIKLLQNNKESYGYLLVKAVYQKALTHDSDEARQEHFAGLAVGVFTFNEWIPVVIKDLSPVGMDVMILDKSAPLDNQFLHFQPSRTRDVNYQPSYDELIKGANGLHWQTTITVMGRQWSFVFAPAPAYLKGKRDIQSWAVLMAGMLISALLALYLLSKSLHTNRMTVANIALKKEISWREAHESELKAQRDFTDTVLNAASDIVVVLDLYGRIVRFNRAAAELTHFSSEEVLGKVVWDLVIPEEQVSAVQQVFNQLRNSQIKIMNQYENEWLTREGERRLLKWHNSVLFDDNDKISHVVAMGYDITDQKQAEEKQERLQRELQQAHKMESLGQLTGGIAHDFNNLLGIINGYSSLVLDNYINKGDEKLADYMEHITEAGDRAARLVAQMLAFSRSDQKADEIIQLAPLFKNDVEMLRATLPSTIEIKTDIDEDLPSVMLSPIHLHQILMNLSINARDAMQGVGELSIRLGWARNLNTESLVSHKRINGDWIELSISDTGSGIDGEVAENVFNPFFTTKEVGKGTGMGLSVIYGIMKNHGGHILLESELEKGSTFRMLFPPVCENNAESLTDSQQHIEAPEGQGKEILVVDDEVSLGNYMAEYLTNHGYKAIYIEDSTEALTLFKQHPMRFSLLITDLTMPKLTGVELIQKIREIRPDMPAILCTGYSDSFGADTSAEMHVPYFDKPVDGEKVLIKIAELLAENYKS